MWLGRLFHLLRVEQNQIHNRWARLVLAEYGGTHTTAPPASAGPQVASWGCCFIERANRDFATNLPVGLHISRGSGAVKELWVGFQGESQPNHGWALQPVVVEGPCLACANEEKAICESKWPSHLESGDLQLFPLWASCCRSAAGKHAHLPPWWSHSDIPAWGSSLSRLMSSLHLPMLPWALSHVFSHVHCKSSDGPSAYSPRPGFGRPEGSATADFPWWCHVARHPRGEMTLCCLACSEFLDVIHWQSASSGGRREHSRGSCCFWRVRGTCFDLVFCKFHENGSLQSPLFLSWFPSVLSKSFLCYLAFRTSRPLKAPIFSALFGQHNH